LEIDSRRGESPWPGVALELLLIGVAAAVYGGVRALTEREVDVALTNARHILDLEQALGVAWERSLQGAILANDAVVTLANWIYIWGHWPVITAAAVYLYAKRRDGYRLLRNAMFISGGVGFAFFALLPVAPPRFLPGYVDTVLERSSSYRTLQPPSVTNAIAAMPSLHFGWNLLVGVVLFGATRHVLLRGFAVAMPVAMAFSVVVTANHFVLDVVVGGLLVAVAFTLARRMTPKIATTLGALDEPSPARRAPGDRAWRRQRPASLAHR
jgi:hypothetical protein